MKQIPNFDNAGLPEVRVQIATRRTAIVALFGLGCSATGLVQAGEWWTTRSRKRRAVCRHGIPVADYRSRNRTPSFRSATLKAMNQVGQLSVNAGIEQAYQIAAQKTNSANAGGVDEPPAVPPSVKEFVMAEAKLGESPFSISGVRFSINSNGVWDAALRAEYNTVDASGKPVIDLVKKRHQFQAFLRFYASRPSSPNQQNENPALAAGHLFEIELGEFWVSQNQTAWKTFGGRDMADVKHKFALVSFAEVEYFVYLDQFSRPAGLATDGRTLR